MTVEVLQGATATLDLELRNRDGDLADADAGTLSLTVVEIPSEVAVTGFPVAAAAITNLGTGLYRYLWEVADDQTTSAYEARWNGSVATEQIETATEAVFVGAAAAGVTVADFREYVTTALTAAALQTLLDAALEAINIHAGTADPVTEWFTPSGQSLMLSRRATSITTVDEYAHLATPTTLSADDYALSTSGYVLRRLRDGTNATTYWRPRVAVTYVPYSDTSLREMAQIELVKLDIAFNPGLASQTIGSWSEAYVQGKSYTEQRADILATLTESTGIW